MCRVCSSNVLVDKKRHFGKTRIRIIIIIIHFKKCLMRRSHARLSNAGEIPTTIRVPSKKILIYSVRLIIPCLNDGMSYSGDNVVRTTGVYFYRLRGDLK